MTACHGASPPVAQAVLDLDARCAQEQAVHMLTSTLSHPGFCYHRVCRGHSVAVQTRPCRPHLAHKQQVPRQRAIPQNGHSNADDEEFEGLTPEEDWTVPGGYQDSLSSNTELGRAVQDACDELDNLSSLEKESLTQASELLQKLGYKGNILKDTSSKEALLRIDKRLDAKLLSAAGRAIIAH